MPQELTEKMVHTTSSAVKNGDKVKPFDKVWITWTMGELAGKSTQEHPALAAKMVESGKATNGKAEPKAEKEKGGTK